MSNTTFDTNLKKYLNSKPYEWRSFLLILALVFVSGNPGISRRIPIESILIVFTLFLGFLLFRNQKLILASFISVASIFAGVLLWQCVFFSFYPITTMLGFFTRLFIGYAVMMLVPYFPYIFVDVMSALALLSLPFYLLQLLSQMVGFNFIVLFKPLLNIIDPNMGPRKYALFHTFTFVSIDRYRNAGIFWEPGAFAGYLILALIFLSVIKKTISQKKFQKRLVIILIALLTTKSTTGYILLPLVLILQFDLYEKCRRIPLAKILIVFYLIVPLIIVLSIYFYNNLEFVAPKIQRQIYLTKHLKFGWHRSRFGSIKLDWEYFRKHPLVGWGLHPKTRYMLHPWITLNEGMGNGMSDFIVKMGIIGFGTFLFFVYIGMLRLTNSRVKSFFILILIILLLQGECFLGLPLFLSLMFLKEAHLINASFDLL